MTQNTTNFQTSDIFADTAGWGHLVDASQPYHSQAASIYRKARQEKRRFITTNYILNELVALLISPLRVPRPRIAAFVESLKASPNVEVIHIDAALDRQSWEFFKQRDDKEWTLVDCSSFVLMKERHMTEAFTTDHHFEQAGYICLLKP